jgi:hypothetical protein
VATYDAGRKFVIDIIPANCPPLIYVLESDAPRIAFIGRPLTLAPGALYLSQDHRLHVQADDAEADIADTAVSLPTPAAPSAAAIAPADGSRKPKLKEPVQIYWRPVNGGEAVSLRSVAGLPSIVYRAAWIPKPDPNRPYNPTEKFIGASYQRMAAMLAEMCAEKIIDATFIAQRTADQLPNPVDIALSGRPDTSTAPVVPPPPPPVPVEVPDAGASGGPLPLQP